MNIILLQQSVKRLHPDIFELLRNGLDRLAQILLAQMRHHGGIAAIFEGQVEQWLRVLSVIPQS